jgi:two-component system NtrC family sensor kinase
MKGSLARKLIVAVGMLIVVGWAVSWYVLISSGRRNLINSAIEYTTSHSDLVKKSVHYSMLTFHRDAIQQIVGNIGRKDDIESIRIFDGKGEIFYSSVPDEIGGRVDRDSFACKGCHSDPEKPAETLLGRKQWTIYTGKEGHRVLTFIDPIYNESSCSTAVCHAHSQKQKVLGILETDFSLSTVDKTIQRQTAVITVYAVLFIGVSAIVFYLILQRFVLKPVSILSDAMEKVETGDLSRTVDIHSKDEMGRLGGTFNMMMAELEKARKKLENWAQTLEEEVAKKTGELKQSQEKLIQAEKLASLGRLTSDVAHEIRNPLSAIGGFARRLNKIVVNEKEKEYAGIVVTEVDRLEKILRDVLTFSRDAKFHLERHEVEDVVRDVLKVYQDLCDEQSIKLTVESDDGLPDILIDRDQVRQALGNLITNAIDSMPGGGTLTVKAGRAELYGVTFVFVSVSDTGTGIPEDRLPLIFEPFFSTKETGHGTGLGLSITRKIMEEHGGFIKAESSMGEGSTFSLYFPYQGPEESQKINCWEFMQCGRDKDATIKCPAYPHFGRICWAVAGTFCEGKVQGTFAQKCEDCKKCAFFQKRTEGEV